MRDPDRIDKLLAQIGTIWKANPDLRLLQLLCNVDDRPNPLYYLEDDALEAKLQVTYTDVLAR